MSTRFIHGRAACLLMAIAFTSLLGHPASAHKAHKAAATSQAVTVPSPVSPAALIADPTPTAPATEAPTHDHSAHSHEGHEPTAKTGERISALEWVGRLHPSVVHFPIALLLSAFIAEMVFAKTGELMFRHSVRIMLWGGTLSAVPAACLGWAFAETGPTEQRWLLDAHRWMGTSTALMAPVILVLQERVERADLSRIPMRIGLAIVAASVAATGFLGGSLLYGIDHLSRLSK